MNKKQITTWDTEVDQKYPKLEENIETETVVIGGGITGIITSYLLARAGRRVVLLEADRLGYGATVRTTAMITQQIDTPLADLENMIGAEKTKLIWKSGGFAIRELRRIIEHEQINCDFTMCPASIFANRPKDFKTLVREHEVATRLGIELDLHTPDGLAAKNYGYLMVPDQAKFHPLKFVTQLSRRAREVGANIFEHTQGGEITKTNEGYEIMTGTGKTVKTKHIVFATYRPLTQTGTHFKKGMYVSYMIEAEIPHGLLWEGLYMDTANPYHYFRIDKGERMDRILIGGEDHRSAFKINKKKSFQALEQYLKDILGKSAYTITRQWVGPILEPSDGLPLIGFIAPNQYVASAFSGNGMTYSTVAAHILSDAILGKENPYAKLYDPRRIPNLMSLLIKGRDYSGELIHGALRNALR